jgi:SPP1 family phage portal protein
MLEALRPILSFGSNEVSESERIASKIEADSASGLAQKDFILAETEEWINSEEFKRMRLGQLYYKNRNEVLKRKRQVIGRNGEMTDAPYLANQKLPHAFMRKLTKQKIGYILAKPFTVTSEDEAFQAALSDYLDTKFHRMFKNAAQDAIVQGMGWIQPYYDESGILKFKRQTPTEIRPFWEDTDHTILGGLIRIYDVEVYDGRIKTLERHIKYFTPQGTYNYISDTNGLILDPEAPVEYHFQLQRPITTVDEETGEEIQTTEMEEALWDKIPMVCLKYNAEEDSLLTFVKDLIDDYDRRTSDLSNTLEDEPNRIKVVRDYDGTDKGEFVYNLARYRTLFLRGTGDCTTLDTSISTDALENHLNRTRRDIFEFGAGVDTQNKNLGDTSGKALKFIYADLDSDAMEFSVELSASLEQLIWFIKQDLLARGQDFLDSKFEITFNTDITINESETIENLTKSVGIISNKTLLEQHPFVKDVTAEENQIKIERQEMLDRVQTEMALQQQTDIPLTDINLESEEE